MGLRECDQLLAVGPAQRKSFSYIAKERQGCAMAFAIRIYASGAHMIALKAGFRLKNPHISRSPGPSSLHSLDCVNFVNFVKNPDSLSVRPRGSANGACRRLRVGARRPTRL